MASTTTIVNFKYTPPELETSNERVSYPITSANGYVTYLDLIKLGTLEHFGYSDYAGDITTWNDFFTQIHNTLLALNSRLIDLENESSTLNTCVVNWYLWDHDDVYNMYTQSTVSKGHTLGETLPSLPGHENKLNYTWLGWFTSSDNTGTEVTTSTIVNNNPTSFYGRYQQNAQILHTLVYNPNGGEYKLNNTWYSTSNIDNPVTVADGGNHTLLSGRRDYYDLKEYNITTTDGVHYATITAGSNASLSNVKNDYKITLTWWEVWNHIITFSAYEPDAPTDNPGLPVSTASVWEDEGFAGYTIDGVTMRSNHTIEVKAHRNTTYGNLPQLGNYMYNGVMYENYGWSTQINDAETRIAKNTRLRTDNNVSVGTQYTSQESNPAQRTVYVQLFALWKLADTSRWHTFIFNFNGSSNAGVMFTSNTYEAESDVHLLQGVDDNPTIPFERPDDADPISFINYYYKWTNKWNENADGTGTDYEAGTNYIMPDNDSTLYVKWAHIPYVKVVYMQNTPGSSTPSVMDTVYVSRYDTNAARHTINGDKAINGPYMLTLKSVNQILDLTNLTGVSYNFNGWATSADGSGTVFSIDDINNYLINLGNFNTNNYSNINPTSYNITLYAQWTPRDVTAQYLYIGTIKPSTSEHIISNIVDYYSNSAGSRVLTKSNFNDYNENDPLWNPNNSINFGTNQTVYIAVPFTSLEFYNTNGVLQNIFKHDTSSSGKIYNVGGKTYDIWYSESPISTFKLGIYHKDTKYLYIGTTEPTSNMQITLQNDSIVQTGQNYESGWRELAHDYSSFNDYTSENPLWVANKKVNIERDSQKLYIAIPFAEELEIYTTSGEEQTGWTRNANPITINGIVYYVWYNTGFRNYQYWQGGIYHKEAEPIDENLIYWYVSSEEPTGIIHSVLPSNDTTSMGWRTIEGADGSISINDFDENHKLWDVTKTINLGDNDGRCFLVLPFELTENSIFDINGNDVYSMWYYKFGPTIFNHRYYVYENINAGTGLLITEFKYNIYHKEEVVESSPYFWIGRSDWRKDGSNNNMSSNNPLRNPSIVKEINPNSNSATVFSDNNNSYNSWYTLNPNTINEGETTNTIVIADGDTENHGYNWYMYLPTNYPYKIVSNDGNYYDGENHFRELFIKTTNTAIKLPGMGNITYAEYDYTGSAPTGTNITIYIFNGEIKKFPTLADMSKDACIYVGTTSNISNYEAPPLNQSTFRGYIKGNTNNPDLWAPGITPTEGWYNISQIFNDDSEDDFIATFDSTELRYWYILNPSGGKRGDVEYYHIETIEVNGASNAPQVIFNKEFDDQTYVEYTEGREKSCRVEITFRRSNPSNPSNPSSDYYMYIGQLSPAVNDGSGNNEITVGSSITELNKPRLIATGDHWYKTPVGASSEHSYILGVTSSRPNATAGWNIIIPQDYIRSVGIRVNQLSEDGETWTHVSHLLQRQSNCYIDGKLCYWYTTNRGRDIQIIFGGSNPYITL